MPRLAILIGPCLCAYVKDVVAVLTNVMIHRLGEIIAAYFQLAMLTALSDVCADVHNMGCHKKTPLLSPRGARGSAWAMYWPGMRERMFSGIPDRNHCPRFNASITLSFKLRRRSSSDFHTT